MTRIVKDPVRLIAHYTRVFNSDPTYKNFKLLTGALALHPNAVGAVLDVLDASRSQQRFYSFLNTTRFIAALRLLIKHVPPGSEYEDRVVTHLKRYTDYDSLGHRIKRFKGFLKNAQEGGKIHAAIAGTLAQFETEPRKVRRASAALDTLREHAENGRNRYTIVLRNFPVQVGPDGALKGKNTKQLFVIVAKEVARHNPVWRVARDEIRTIFRTMEAPAGPWNFNASTELDFRITSNNPAENNPALPAEVRVNIERRIREYLAAPRKFEL